jgi:hypothetical protein
MTNLEDRIQTYLDAIPPAISRLGGHDQTFKVACRLVNGFALSPEQAIHWLRVYNGKCDPPGAKLTCSTRSKAPSPRTTGDHAATFLVMAVGRQPCRKGGPKTPPVCQPPLSGRNPIR